MPEVSIVVAVYNTEQYLRECLDSLANQTLKDLEIVCVDDASPDHSYAILEEYAAKDARFKIFRNEKNSGVSATKARGAELATGKYLYFIDCDDWIEPNTMEVCHQIAEERRTDLVVIDYEVFGDAELKKSYLYRAALPRPEARVMTGMEFFCQPIWDFPPWQRFILRSFYEEKKPLFDPRAIPDDIVFSTRCDFQAQRVFYRGGKFYHYRLRKSSVTFRKGGNLAFFLGLRITIKDVLAQLRGREFPPEVCARIAEWKRYLIVKLKNYLTGFSREEYEKLFADHPEIAEYLELVELAGPLTEKLDALEKEADARAERAGLNPFARMLLCWKERGGRYTLRRLFGKKD